MPVGLIFLSPPAHSVPFVYVSKMTWPHEADKEASESLLQNKSVQSYRRTTTCSCCQNHYRPFSLNIVTIALLIVSTVALLLNDSFFYLDATQRCEISQENGKPEAKIDMAALKAENRYSDNSFVPECISTAIMCLLMIAESS
jgi:hypothetical protein